MAMSGAIAGQPIHSPFRSRSAWLSDWRHGWHGLHRGPLSSVQKNRPNRPGIHTGAGQSRSALRTAVIASAVLVSHALLDTLTDGGLGCALLWPFDLTRYFAPWNPIPVAPIGWSFLSVYGLGVALTEMVLFGPVFWFALSRRRTRRS